MRILLNGATGRMGQSIANSLSVEDTIVYAINSTSSWEDVNGEVDVAIDFSSSDGAARVLPFAEQYKIPLVIGTTNLTESVLNNMKNAANSIKIVHANNFSIGVNVMYSSISCVAKTLPSEFQTEIIDTHHKYKKDAPSGTAKEMANIICDTRNIEHVIDDNKYSINTCRENNILGVHSLRCGTIAGEHKVIFAGDDEIITIEHRALSRKIFANGALLAARWLLKQSVKSGLFSMSDVLGI